ncbi:MAG: EpsI family protein [Candidatus Omnitrophica bacterium]|nr:EpsI family protein [Candidatus Omnitrophota bacterium]
MKTPFRIIIIVSVLVTGLWAFPGFWYHQLRGSAPLFWLAERAHIDGWTYQEIPVSKAEEKALVADRIVSGKFTGTNGEAVSVFSAKRYNESRNDIGLFVHTPDRCWTEAGWKIQPASPDCVQVDVHGIKLMFERRVFCAGSDRELVYFAGIAGGRPLPYRLDHNLSVALKYQMDKGLDNSGMSLRASDSRLWDRVWESFVSRSPLLGPKQFIRIGTPIRSLDLVKEDALLRDFLVRWLEPVDYNSELQAAIKNDNNGSLGR